MDTYYGIINFGTSHGSLFDYSLISEEGVRFNKSGNTLYYDYQNYQFIKNKLKDKAIVIIPVSYFSFGQDENRRDTGFHTTFDYDFYEYLPAHAIYNYSLKKHLMTYRFKIIDNLKFLVFGPDLKKQSLDTKQLNANELKKHAVLRVKRHKKQGVFKERNYKYLDTLISTIIKDDFVPILLTVPYYRDYNDGFGKEWLNFNYFKAMDSLALRHNVKYLNYSKTPTISNNPNYFQNSDHLNNYGIKVFSELLFHDILEKL
ncbi:hypothetical protein [Winogradskyella sp. A3E31]|uniref:hypothetical protein n=1 Tax=Winogradskyella sp. A3E31 TaxID=3349637 RepID=UPI00398A5D46